MCVYFFNDTATTEIYTLSYTTLFRSEGLRLAEDRRLDPSGPRPPRRAGLPRRPPARRLLGRRGQGRGLGHRSEEHTSELQSRQYLVCRLLLEKKKHHPATKFATRSVV